MSIYAGDFEIGLFEGQIANTEEVIARTGYNADTVPILPGRFVAIAAGKEQNTEPSLSRLGLTLPAAATDKIVGVVRMHPITATEDRKPKDQIAYLAQGTIGVKSLTVGKAGDPVHVVIAAGSDRGLIKNAADGANTVLVANCRYITTVAANETARISVNLA